MAIGCGGLFKLSIFKFNRAYPGGSFVYMIMIRAMIDINYRGYVTIEYLTLLSLLECAERVLSYIKHLKALLEIKRLLLDPP